MTHVHMIKNRKTGLFSTGGMYPSFGKTNGKMWTTTGKLNQHLSQLGHSGIRKFYADCDLVSYELKDPLTSDLAEMAEKAERKENLVKLHKNDNFAALVLSIEQKNQTEEYRWIVHQRVQPHKQTRFRLDMTAMLKEFGIKKNTYRVSGETFAFKNKIDAAKFRISALYEHFSYDATTLKDIDLTK